MTDIDKLTKPFPPGAVKWRWADRAQTRKLDYVEGHTIIHRLNDATENRWSLTVDKVERFPINENNILVMAHVTLEIPGLGRRSHIGVQAVNDRGGEDLVKGAITDALKKAATLFGVGLELYGPDYEAGEVEQHENSELPARARTEGHNTIPANGSVGTRDTVNDWTGFWREVEALGLPRDKKELESLLGTSIGANPAFALEKVKAYVHDMTAKQPALDGGFQSEPGAQTATPRQLKYIEAIAREAGISDNEINAEAEQLYGRSVAQLERRDASAFIERLQSRRNVTELAS